MPDRLKRPRPDVLCGKTIKKETSECGNLYITLNTDGEDAFECFIVHGKAGACEYAHKEAIGRLISIALQAGADPKKIALSLRGIQCNSSGWGSSKSASCLDMIGQALVKMTKNSTDDVIGGLVEE